LAKAGECVGERKIFINIDHHESNTRYADVNWVSPREPSTGELIFRLMKVARWPITRPIADQLFTAISTDNRLVPVSDDPARHAARQRGTRHAWREPRENLRRSLSVVSAVAREAAPARFTANSA